MLLVLKMFSPYNCRKGHGKLLLSYLNTDIVIHQPQLFHVVTITHFIIQNSDTALMQASFKGHHGVVELLLGAGANPDMQNKVSTGRDSSVYSNLSDG